MSPLLLGLGALVLTVLATSSSKRGVSIFAPILASTKPAKKMTEAEAVDQMDDYEDQGLVQIISRTSPMIISGKIAGVQYVYVGESGETSRTRIDNLDPRFAVLLVRLSTLLHSMGVDEVLDLGITHGSKNLRDVHNRGLAIDLAGVRGPSTDLVVLRDWYGKPKPKDLSAYRLHPGDKGYEMFKRIYEFATNEATDKRENPQVDDVASKIGESSYILTPDHPSPKYSYDHRNHFHIQIGPTYV